MKKTDSIHFRLPIGMRGHLQSIAKKYGHTESSFLVMILERFVEDYERNGGCMAMPLEFKSMREKCAELEGRDTPAKKREAKVA